jgi:hypothetical protein
MADKEPVFNEFNYDLVVIAVGGSVMFWVILPWWLATIGTSLMFGTVYSFYKSRRATLDRKSEAPKAEVFDARGTFVGYTTYRIVK